MAEGFELVRTVRQHIRRSAALFDEGKVPEALAEVDQALALDPQSVPAQALRDRIQLKSPTRTAPHSFVPHGVNAASWRGFEQRITERRFKALLETISTSVVAGDSATARAALDEARELRPDAPELAEFEARVAAVPLVAAAAHGARSTARIWMRAMGAAALFLVGVSLLLGLEWIRPDQRISAPAPVSAPELPAVAPAPDLRPATTPNLGSVPVALTEEEESVPAIVTPPEPLRPRATTGTATMPPELTGRPVAMRNASPPAVERTLERRVVEDEEEEPSGPRGEISDSFVAAPRAAAATTLDAGRAIAPPSMAPDTPVNADGRGRVAPPAATVSAAAAIPAAVEQGRVEEVLRRYARAYGDLNASAARAVWPTVDERALARAFQNLSSQSVAFDDCEIAIRGVVANASCGGRLSYVGKVGSREPKTEPRQWRFELRREGDAWRIEQAEMRRQSSAEYRN